MRFKCTLIACFVAFATCEYGYAAGSAPDAAPTTVASHGGEHCAQTPAGPHHHAEGPVAFFSKLFDTAGFPPRWNCGIWPANVGWLHIVSDAAIFGAYVAIPVVLLFFLRRRKDLPFPAILWLFAAFILACGFGHLIEAGMFWWPVYRFSGVVKAITAVVSWATVVALIPILPKLFSFPGMASLNKRLQAEVAERREAQARLQASYEELQQFEHSLRMSETRYSALFETSLDAIVVLKGGVIVDCNTAALRMFRHADQQELLGRHLADFSPPTQSGGYDSRKLADEFLAEAVRDGSTYFEWVCRRTNESEFPVEVLLSLIVTDGESIIHASIRDISMRRQTAARLEESDERFRLLVENIHDVFWILDPKTRNVIYISPAFEKIWAVPCADVYRNPLVWMDRVHQEDRRRVQTAYNDLFATGEFDIEFRVVPENGDTRWVHCVSLPVSNPDGGIYRIAGVAHDVTDAKSALDRLAAQHRITAFRAKVGVYFSRDETMTDVLAHACQAIVDDLRAAFARIWTMDSSGETLELQASAGLYTHVDGDHARIPLGQYKIGRIAKNAKPHLTNDVMNDPNISDPEWARRENMVSFAGYPLIVAGRVLGVLGLFAHKELSVETLEGLAAVADSIAHFVQRKQSEEVLARKSLEARLLHQTASMAAETEKFEDALQNSLNAVCESTDWPIGHVYLPSDDGNVLEPSEIWCTEAEETHEQYRRITQSQTFRKGIGLPGRIWRSGEPAWIADIQTDGNFLRAPACQDLGIRAAFGFPVKIRGQTAAILEFFAEEERAPDGDFLAIMASVGEQLGRVLERQRAQNELRAAKTLAEESTRAKSQFLASMSHELRTPLNGVIGMTELLKDSKLTLRQRQFADACHTSAETLLNLINDILDFSKIEAGRLELDYHECDLEELIASTADITRFRAQQKGLELICQLDPAALLTVQGDSVRLRQVLVNLISNASKFTEKGEIVVRVQAEPGEDDKTLVRFSVSDTGIGIPESKRDRLFRSFSQVDCSTTRKYGGTGLGLAICKSLVELMGGTISVQSNEGVGSEFSFTVPLEVVARRRLNGAANAEIMGKRVLIVDDNETNRVILRENTTAWGMQAEEAASVEEALELIRRGDDAGNPFRIVLTDLQMPGQSGLDLARSLNHRDDLAVVLLGSCDAMPCTKEQRRLRIARALQKPIKQSELYNAIVEAITGRESEQHDDALTEAEPLIAPATQSHPILLAEDNDINRMYVTELLKRQRLECETVINGCEAIESIRTNRYALVLMDCQMPEMDGFEATRRIRQLEKSGELPGHQPIIALTANAIKGDRERCLEAGMDDYVSKPVDAEKLIAAMRPWLESEDERNGAATDDHSKDEKKGNDAAMNVPIDSAALMTRCFDNVEFALSLLDEFEVSGEERAEKIAQHVASGDSQATAETAHSLKGTAGILCAESLQAFAAELERAGRSTEIDSLDSLSRQLLDELHRCLNYMPELRQKLQSAHTE